MNIDTKLPMRITDCAANRINFFVSNKNTNHSDLKLRVYIESGGCGGFQYGFVLDNHVLSNDCIIRDNGAILIIDALSLQYLFGGIVDYYEGLEGSKFIIINPNAKTTCSCGLSFNI